MSDTNPTLKITAYPTTESQICIFTLDQKLMDGSLNCTRPDLAQGAPLLEALFSLEGISQVMVSGLSLTVAKSSDEPWVNLGKKIGAIIREQHARGGLLITQAFIQNFEERVMGPRIEATDLKGQIQRVLDTEVNPSVASHGGHIKLEDLQGSRLLVTMSGGCKGCSSAQVTLKQGVERIVFSKFPQITEVVDVTDHASGTRPYM
jgi:NFU1 iron-sulfur cluster scaffold homolog, mitochondrial